MLKILTLVLIFSIGCSVHTFDLTHRDSDQLAFIEEKQPCDTGLEEKIKTFYSSASNDFRDVERDNKIVTVIQKCPRAEIVKSLVALQKAKPDDVEISAKTSYFLLKLNHERAENGRNLISTYSAKLDQETIRYKEKDFKRKLDKGEYDDSFSLDRLMNLICEAISNDDPKSEFLANSFDLVQSSDGAMSETLSGTLAGVFEKSPETFLQELKPKSTTIRQQTYAFLFYSIGKERVMQHLDSITRNSKASSLIEELRKFRLKRT